MKCKSTATVVREQTPGYDCMRRDVRVRGLMDLMDGLGRGAYGEGLVCWEF